MYGSEKQIKWAMDIVEQNKAAVERHLENSRRRAEVDGAENPYWNLALQASEICCNHIIEGLDKLDNAGAIINGETPRYAILKEVLFALSAEEQEVIKFWEREARKSPSVGRHNIMSLLVG